MPRIPEYNEQYRYAGRAGNLGGRLNPGDYGGTAGAIGASGRIAGQQWQQAGAALTQAADAAAVICDDYNTAKAQQAVSGLQKNFLAWQSEMSKNKGEAGMDAGARYEQWQKKQVAELTKGMNDIQRGRFNALAEVKAAGFRQWAADYGSEQGLVFRNAEDVAGIKASGEVLVANLTNPSIAEPAMESIAANAKSIAKRKGLGEAARARFVRDALSESITPAIAAQIDAGKLSTARTALLHYKDKIGAANARKLQAAIQREGRRLEAKARAEQERAEREQAASMGNSLFQNHRMDADAAQKEILDTIKDPIQQERVLQSYLTRSSLEERLQTRTAEHARATEYADAMNKSESVLADQNLTDKSAALTDLLGQISDPSIRKQTSDYIDFRLNGAEAPVDKNVLAEAQAYAAQPGVRPDMVTNRYADKLPFSALGKAVKIARDEAVKQSEKLMQDEITDSLVDDFGYTRSQATAGYRIILSRMTGLTDPAQRLEAARQLARKISVKNDAWFSGSGWGSGKQEPAYNFPRIRREDPSFRLVEVPEEVIPMIDAALRAKGETITEQSRKATYANFLEAKKNEESK
ncbi:MAG: hypothetical protein LUG19_11645 [Desulfovibrio sp.]|uniref:hypothetical protein n=1 Tax=Desulfovibrio sp. TaxID=885 RepID=UPI00258F6AC4|nr:hypothetical protein [Desulfovibrio sp.]MCD7984884.1 hypothetical protein [Desulfovibrio sp.]